MVNLFEFLAKLELTVGDEGDVGHEGFQSVEDVRRVDDGDLSLAALALEASTGATENLCDGDFIQQ